MAHSKKTLKLVKDFQREMQRLVDNPKSGITKITFSTQDRPTVTIAEKTKEK